MPDYYSDHYSDDGTAVLGTVTANAIDDPRGKTLAAIAHAGLKYKRGSLQLDVDVAAADILRFFTLKSGDHLHELTISKIVATGLVDGDIGLHNVAVGGSSGAAKDFDLFCKVGNAPGADLTDVSDRVSLIAPADLVAGWRGKSLWELLGLTVDPIEDYDVTITINAETSIVADEWIVEAVYTAGGE